MQSENNQPSYLSGIIRDGLTPFHFRKGIKRLLGISELQNPLVGSYFRIPPSMKYSLSPMSSRAHSISEMNPGGSQEGGSEHADNSVGRAMSGLKAHEEQVCLIQGASENNEQLLSDGNSNCSKPAGTEARIKLQSEKHCCNPKIEVAVPNIHSEKLHVFPQEKKTAAPGSDTVAQFHRANGDTSNEDTGPLNIHKSNPGAFTSCGSGMAEAEGIAVRTSSIVLPGGATLGRIVPPAAGDIRPLSGEQGDDDSFQNVPEDGRPQKGRRPYAFRSTKKRDKAHPEGFQQEDSSDTVDSGEHQFAYKGRSSDTYIAATGKDRPFPEGSNHTHRGSQTARTEELSGNQAAHKLQAQQIVIVRQQPASEYETAAFWERRYLSRLRLRSVR